MFVLISDLNNQSVSKFLLCYQSYCNFSASNRAAKHYIIILTLFKILVETPKLANS